MKERVLPHYFTELHIMNGGFAYTNKFDFKINSEKTSHQKLQAISLHIYSFVLNLKLESTLPEGNFEQQQNSTIKRPKLEKNKGFQIFR